MNGILLDIGTALLSNGWQIVAGSIIAIPLYFLPKIQWEGKGLLNKTVIIILAAVGGMILPLNIYGMIPVALSLLARGLGFSLVLPMLMSNLIFNMLVPFTDPVFVWRTGIPRVIFALLTGIITGVLLTFINILQSDVNSWFHGKGIRVLSGESFNIKNIISNSGWNILILAVFLLCGALTNSVFHRIVWVKFMQIMVTNPQTAFLPRLFASLNVTNPIFLLDITIVATLMDFTKLSALFAIMKSRSLFFYIIYNLVWIGLLAVTIFFR